MGALRSLIVLVGLVASSCTAGGITPVAAAGLQPFDGCGEFLRYVKQHALERVTPYGLPGGGWTGVPVPFAAEPADGLMSAEMEGGAARSMEPAAPAHSGTNVQVEGVDEPDIVKTDGERIVAIAGERLFVVDATGPAPRLLGSTRLRGLYPRDMLLLADRALVLGEAGEGASFGPSPETHAYTPTAAVLEVDLRDPARPAAGRRLLLDGSYVSARATGGTARIVVSSFPAGLAFEPPEQGGLRDERRALERNREVIRRSTIEDWVPYFVLEGADGRTAAEGPLLDCASAHHPPEFSGFGMLTVLSLDLARGLTTAPTGTSVGVLSDGDTIYASQGSLYVATQRWFDPAVLERGPEALEEERVVTRIHRFDISSGGAARYRSSGEVAGWLLNQFSMDEHEGHLRVASTDAPPFSETASESGVTVLAERGDRLERVGGVGGLGKGERIFAVRFLGDLGYVVTFRQVDPLYVVDLSDPARPTVEGELKIPGYSAYLHPLPDGRLLGVGQDATNEGVTRGTQVSLFDVADPTDPRRIDSLRVSGGSSEAEWDHHAFLYWEPEGLVVVPVNVYEWEDDAERPGGFFGAVAFRLKGDRLERAGRISHAGEGHAYEEPGIRRSLVIGEQLYTMSDAGIAAADLETLDRVGWVPFR